MRTSVERVRTLLLKGEIELLGLLPRASNYTFAVRVKDAELETIAVYKPQAGERPLWDFPGGTLYQREIAAYEVSEALGWNLIPPTVEREGPHGVGSLQLFIDAEPAEHYLSLMPARAEVFRRVAALDLVINNADRKSGHCLLEKGSAHIWVVDHGVTFHHEMKLRTVIWEFAGEELSPELRSDLGALRDAAIRTRLRSLLSEAECAAFEGRLETLVELGHFPDPPQDRRPYPWPPI